MSETGNIGMFKAKRQTRRFNLNQKVWVINDFGNHLWIVFRWRGKGRYVSGRMNKWHTSKNDFNVVIGSEGIKNVEIDKTFYDKIIKNFR